MDQIETTSTSRNTAECPPVVLRETERVRFLFQPTIIGENPKDPDAQVRGILRYQRKGKDDTWDNVEVLGLNRVRMNEEVAIEIPSVELKILVREVERLYSLVGIHGIEPGKNTFVRVSDSMKAFLEISLSDLGEFLDKNVVDASNMMKRILKWASSAKAAEEIINSLDEQTISDLEDIQAVASIRRLKDLIREWEVNAGNADEEYWQKLFTQNSHIFQLLFAVPVTLVKGKAYVGGKSITNTGGNLADFLLKNSISENAAIIEIKTPATKLLKAAYRSTFSLSEDLTGGLSQVLLYKHELVTNYQALAASSSGVPSSFDPECLVIVGNSHLELDNPSKRRAFELFRGQLGRVKILTFDEVIGKVRGLLSTLQLERKTEELTDSDCPF